ncbi:hypothetical protein E3C22_18070 [Jiella endophytica]|uniref:Uncharacterized protein n=1 Tax=Jiella endophytica TaxID=2558362 RepID=A0A4Y8REQ4_9HYPH|nr:hypothetical protein [Jiella endophytica]TFF20796.1 hypothetical protein E3C22_18070 [Jiella endophytica]
MPHLTLEATTLRTGCTWPVEVEGHSGPQLFCDAPVSLARRESGQRCWCDTHAALGRGEWTGRSA